MSYTVPNNTPDNRLSEGGGKRERGLETLASTSCALGMSIREETVILEVMKM